MHHDLCPGLLVQLAAFLFDLGDTLFQLEQWPLIAVDRDTDHQFINKRRRPPDDVDVTQSNRVEGAGVKAYAHGRVQSFQVVIRSASKHLHREDATPISVG